MTCRFSGGTTAVARAARQVLGLPGDELVDASSGGSCSAQKSRIRSSPATLAAELCRVCHDSRDKSAHEVQRRHRRPPADRLAVAREVEPARRARRPGRPRAGRRGRPASRRCRRPARRCRSPRPRHPHRAGPRARAPSPPPSPPRRRRARRARPRGTPSCAALTSFEYATTRPEEDVARAGHVGEPRRDEPAGARLGRRERQARARAAARARAPRSCARRARRDSRSFAATQRRPRARRPAAPRPARRRGRRGSRSRARRS